jgi:hypothetical protein
VAPSLSQSPGASGAWIASRRIIPPPWIRGWVGAVSPLSRIQLSPASALRRWPLTAEGGGGIVVVRSTLSIERSEAATPFTKETAMRSELPPRFNHLVVSLARSARVAREHPESQEELPAALLRRVSFWLSSALRVSRIPTGELRPEAVSRESLDPAIFEPEPLHTLLARMAERCREAESLILRHPGDFADSLRYSLGSTSEMLDRLCGMFSAPEAAPAPTYPAHRDELRRALVIAQESVRAAYRLATAKGAPDGVAGQTWLAFEALVEARFRVLDASEVEWWTPEV